MKTSGPETAPVRALQSLHLSPPPDWEGDVLELKDPCHSPSAAQVPSLCAYPLCPHAKDWSHRDPPISTQPALASLPPCCVS